MRKLLALLLAGALLVLAGCSVSWPFGAGESTPADESESVSAQESTENTAGGSSAVFCYADLPAYDGEPHVEVNGGAPYFTEEEMAAAAEAEPGAAQSKTPAFSELDALGRCGPCTALLSLEGMPQGERGDIREIRPSGWNNVRYEGIDGEFLYNRCHLIAWQLLGNDDERNLITGTRYLNIEGMERWEDKTAYVLYNSGCHVLYRATPVFVDDELVCRGVMLEAVSVEDAGAALSFCVFCYNVQPGITIDYATGASEGPAPGETLPGEAEETDDGREPTYIGNRNSMKFHRPDCESVGEMSERNKVYFYGGREEPVEEGYTPCGVCRP